MSAKLQYSCGFHTANTAADDDNLLRILCRFDVMLVCLHGFSIHRTPCKMQGIHQVLIIRDTLVVAHVEAAIMAENARTDILFLVLHELCDPLGIRKERSGESGTVQLSFRNGFCGSRRIKTAGSYDRDVDKLPDMLNIGQIAVFRHVHRRMCPIPCIIGTVIAVQHVIACILQVLRCLFALFHVTSDFHIVFAGKRTFTEPLGFGNHTVAQ